jgi:S1-C subfamily serine protease
VASGGPAEKAGIKPGDFVIEVAGTRVTDLAETFRKIWAVGPAGSAIPLTIARDGALQRVTIHSADRNDFLKKPRLH